jgi:hypothetical protein
MENGEVKGAMGLSDHAGFLPARKSGNADDCEVMYNLQAYIDPCSVGFWKAKSE